MAESLDEILLHANAVFLNGGFFTARVQDEDGMDAGPDLKRIKAAWSLLRERRTPFVLGMDCPTWGDPALFAWMDQDFSGAPIYQKNLDGSIENGSNEEHAYLCLDHRGVRSYIERTYESVIEELKDHAAHESLLAYSGSPHPLIMQRRPAGGRDGSYYCLNPETVEAWRENLRKRYDGDIVAFDRDFRQTVRLWSEIPAPEFHDSHSPLRMDYEAFLYHSVRDFQNWNLDLINNLDPDRQVFNHGSNISTTLAGEGINQFGTFDSGAVKPYVPGGDVMTVPGHLADGPAYVLDGYRSFGPAALAAHQLGMADGSAPTGEELRLWLAQLAARFQTVYALPAAWPEIADPAEIQGAYDWAMQLGTLDIGQPVLPPVAVLCGQASRCADGQEAFHKRQEVYRHLYRAGVDRVLVSERQIANGWLRQSDTDVLVLPHIRVISEEALEAIHAWTQLPHKRLIVIGPFAELDSNLHPNQSFAPLRDELLASVGTRRVESDDRLGRVVRSAAGQTHPLTPGVEMTATTTGWCLVQAGHYVDVERVEEAPAIGQFDLLINGETLRHVPVQYFTFLFKDGNEWKATTLDADGVFETVKINGNT